MSNQVNSMNKGLTVKDLVTTGIFTALLFVTVLRLSLMSLKKCRPTPAIL